MSVPRGMSATILTGVKPTIKPIHQASPSKPFNKQARRGMFLLLLTGKLPYFTTFVVLPMALTMFTPLPRLVRGLPCKS